MTAKFGMLSNNYQATGNTASDQNTADDKAIEQAAASKAILADKALELKIYDLEERVKTLEKIIAKNT